MRLGTRTHISRQHGFHIQICVISRQMAWHQSPASTRICMYASHDTKSKALNKHSECCAINSVCDFVSLPLPLGHVLHILLKEQFSINEKTVVIFFFMILQTCMMTFFLQNTRGNNLAECPSFSFQEYCTECTCSVLQQCSVLVLKVKKLYFILYYNISIILIIGVL